MKILIIIGVLTFIASSVWYAKRKDVTGEYEEVKIQTNQDKPIDFGYKIVWIAVKTDKKQEVSENIGLKNIQPSNWKSGITRAYENSLFVSPQIGEWTLVVGMGLPFGDSQESIKKIEILLNKLSSEFGEAHFFGTHRVVEYHNWMKSVNGKIKRIYSYVGESMENIKVVGEPTEPEIGLRLFNSLSDEAKADSYFEQENLDYADEELVMKIAENWSVNPTKLTERNDIKNELGLIGKK